MGSELGLDIFSSWFFVGSGVDSSSNVRNGKACIFSIDIFLGGTSSGSDRLLLRVNSVAGLLFILCARPRPSFATLDSLEL